MFRDLTKKLNFKFLKFGFTLAWGVSSAANHSSEPKIKFYIKFNI